LVPLNPPRDDRYRSGPAAPQRSCPRPRFSRPPAAPLPGDRPAPVKHQRLPEPMNANTAIRTIISTAWPEITRFLLRSPSSAEMTTCWRLAPLWELAPNVHMMEPVEQDGQGNQERDPERGRTAGKYQGLNPQEKNHRECRYQHANELGEGGSRTGPSRPSERC